MKRAADLIRDAHEAPDRLREHRLAAEVASLKAREKGFLDRLHLAELRADVLAQLRECKPIPIVRRERKSGMQEATAFLVASDWHVGEEVRPELVNGVNKFNPEIARRRVEKLAQGFEWKMRHHREGSAAFKIRDVVLHLAGDMVTGWLHQDQVATNTLLPMPEVMFATELMGYLIDRVLADAQPESLTVVCNFGNHARTTFRTLHSAQAETSLEFLAYSFLASRFAKDKRVRFELSAGKLHYQDVYEFTVRSSHGDDVNYGGGVGGITIPINKAIAKWNTQRRADVDIMGHWHQCIALPWLVVNGSLIGYSTFSIAIKAGMEPPAQAMFLVQPGRGKRLDDRIWLEAAAPK